MLLQIALLQATLGSLSGVPEPVEYIQNVRALLSAGQFSKVESLFVAAQREAEAGNPNLMHWAMYGTRGISAQIRLSLARWEAASPRAWAPFLVQANELLEAAGSARGSKWASETSPEQFARMAEYDARMKLRCERALQLKPNLCSCHNLLLDAAHRSGESTTSVIERGHRTCPADLDLAMTELNYLTPRWGGSYPQMEAAIAAARSRGVSVDRLPTLRNLIRLDKALVYENERDRDGAVRVLTEGIAAEPTLALFRERARHHRILKQPELALSDANQSILLSKGGWDPAPGNLAAVPYTRAWALHALKREEEARADIRTVLAIAPDWETALMFARQLGIE